MYSLKVPQVRHGYPSLYPTGHNEVYLVHPELVSNPERSVETLDTIYLRAPTSEAQRLMFAKWTSLLDENSESSTTANVMSQYKHCFHGKFKSSYFDLHSLEFQDFSLRLTCRLPQDQIRKLSFSRYSAEKRLLRARVYAIGSRSDVSWEGALLEDQNEIVTKKLQMLDHLKSMRLYDWCTPNSNLDAKPIDLEPPNLAKPKIATWSIRQGTQETIEQIWREMGPENNNNKIAWLNFAAGHNVCGSYSVDWGGSQEEEVATNCDGAVLLGTKGKLVSTGFKSYVRGVWVAYEEGFHIPPGGNYFAKTTFVTGPHAPLHCHMIATAFADFRTYLPFFHPYSERSYFFNLLGYRRDRKELRARQIIDIEGVLKTCQAEGIHTLVTGATGCGAFNHDPHLEAELWEECIQNLNFDAPLKQIVFAVLDDESSPNWQEFSRRFPPR